MWKWRTTPRASGAQAEDRARHYLEGRGLAFLERNFQCRGGEIDLIMADGESLVFVEVRYRRDDRYASPEESVGPRKRRRLIHAALRYLQTHPEQAPRPSRFDVVAISPQHGADAVRWIQDAFQLDE